jgi:competence protein ComEA
VDVDGAVAVPGVYSLPAGSRVEDAVKAAGGLRDDAYRGAVNLAEILEDGMHLHIPVRIPETNKEDQAEISNNSAGSPIGIVNINFASQEILESLPGIGPVTAEAIISFRLEHPFSRIEDLQKVTGIGPATYEKLKDRITVGE